MSVLYYVRRIEEHTERTNGAKSESYNHWQMERVYEGALEANAYFQA